MKKIILLASALSLASLSFAQKDTKVKTDGDDTKIKTGDTKIKIEKGATKIKEGDKKTVIPAAATSFTKLESGLEYKFIKDTPGENKPKLGDQVELHIRTLYSDSVLYDSRVLNNNQPVPFQIMPPSFKGDIVEGMMMMTPGDSAVFRVSVDSFKKAGIQLPPGMDQTGYIDYHVAMVTVKSQEQVKKESEAKASQQIKVDDQRIQDYLKKNNIKASKTASGLYYVIHEKGMGANGKAGQKVTVNYTGKTLDGKIFDSNTDPQFNHVEPFIFTLGQGQVIKGWDEGFQMLSRGSKATLYIPSILAYGDRGAGGAIGPNEVLIFDVEVVFVGDPAPKPEIIKDEKKKDDHGHDHGHDHDGHKH